MKESSFFIVHCFYFLTTGFNQNISSRFESIRGRQACEDFVGYTGNVQLASLNDVVLQQWSAEI